MNTPKDTVTIKCRHCGAPNRLPIEKALKDLSKPGCGSCKNKLFRASGEPLIDITEDDLSHPWDRQALSALRSVPYADKILEKLFAATLDKLSKFNMMAGAVRISDKQAPRLWRLYLEAAGRINVDPPPLFITQNPIMNAFAIGAGQPQVAVTSGLLDGMGDREILGVLGHELTHVKLGHVLYRTLAMLIIQGGLGVLDKLLGIGRVLILPIQVALFRWYQMSELSADRGELITTASLETFVRTHMLLAGGSTRFMDELDVGAFVDQSYAAEKMRDEDLLVMVMETLDNTFRTHPLPAWRVHHGLKWAQTEDFFNILGGVPAKKLESVETGDDA